MENDYASWIARLEKERKDLLEQRAQASATGSDREGKAAAPGGAEHRSDENGKRDERVDSQSAPGGPRISEIDARLKEVESLLGELRAMQERNGRGEMPKDDRLHSVLDFVATEVLQPSIDRIEDASRSPGAPNIEPSLANSLYLNPLDGSAKVVEVRAADSIELAASQHGAPPSVDLVASALMATIGVAAVAGEVVRTVKEAWPQAKEPDRDAPESPADRSAAPIEEAARHHRMEPDRQDANRLEMQLRDAMENLEKRIANKSEADQARLRDEFKKELESQRMNERQAERERQEARARGAEHERG